MEKKDTKSRLIDDYEYLTLGMCSAVRNKDYFLWLKDIFSAMNKIQAELEPGPKSDTYFLDKIFKTKTIGKNWKKIVTLYERGYLPLREFQTSKKEAVAASGGTSLKDLIPAPGSVAARSADPSAVEINTPIDGPMAVRTPVVGVSRPGKGASTLPPDVADGDGTSGEAGGEVREKTQAELDREEELEVDETPREILEYRKLLASLRILYPPPEVLDEDIVRFARYFRLRKVESTDDDFKRCKDALEVTCMRLAAFQSAADEEVRAKDPRLALERREERMRRVRSLFSLASTQFVCSSSSMLKELLIQADRSQRRRFYAGEGIGTIDGELGGFHGTGLISLLGGTSGFKTGFMSSIVANHVLHAYVNGEDPPAIWGYIGEDGVEAYTRRCLTNIMNRDPIMTALNRGAFSLKEFSDTICKDAEFRDAAFSLADMLMGNCHWIKAPEDPNQKLQFSVINILNAFEAKLQAGDKKPSFIVMDYLNLLNLPKEASTTNRAQELSTIAHMLDEWAQQKGLTIITAVQASITGAVGARDMRFYMQEDLHECKSIAHHCRMVISLLPFTEYLEDNKIKRWMAIQILKNRDGQKDQIFVSALNERSNITFADSKLYTESEWIQHKENIIRKKSELFGLDTAQGQDNQRRGGGGQSQGYSRGAGGGQARPQGQGGGKPAFGGGGRPQGNSGPKIATSPQGGSKPPDTGEI